MLILSDRFERFRGADALSIPCPQGMLLSEWGLHGTGALPTLWIQVVGIGEVVNSGERTHPYNRQWVGPRGLGSRVMGAQRGPPGADLSGGPRVGLRHGNWEGRDGALQGGRGPSTALGRGGAAACSGSAEGLGAVGPT